MPATGSNWIRLTERFTLAEKLPIFEAIGYEPHEEQLPVHASRARNRIVINGRRFGKTTMAGAEVIAHAVAGGVVTCGAPTHELAAISWTWALERLLGSRLRSMVRGYRESSGKQIIKLRSGGTIDAKSTQNPKSILGVGRDLFEFDEGAQEPDGEVYHQYIRPSLADHVGGFMLTTTPKGNTWVKELFELGQLREPGYESWQKPSSCNPYLLRSEIENARKHTPRTIFEQEWLAVFIDELGSVFRGYRDCATALWQDEPIEGHEYVMGVDLAQFEDWTVVCIYDMTAGCVAHYLRFNLIPYPEQEQHILEASKKWNAPMLVDATNNQAVAQHLAEECHWTVVDSFIFTQTSKAQVMNSMALAIQEMDLRLLAPDQADDDAQDMARTALSEFSSYRYERTSAGNLRMSAPSGKHDDIVVATGLAFAQMLSCSGGLPISQPREEGRQAPTIAGTFVTPPPAPKAIRRLRRL